MNSLKYIFYITSIFLLFITCKKREKLDLSTIQTYHHLAIPLVNAQIGIEELLKKDTGGLVTTNPQTGEILFDDASYHQITLGFNFGCFGSRRFWNERGGKTNRMF